MSWCDSEQEQVAGFCVRVYEFSGSIKCWKLFDYLRKYKLNGGRPVVLLTFNENTVPGDKGVYFYVS
jgi:hypothetical protein